MIILIVAYFFGLPCIYVYGCWKLFTQTHLRGLNYTTTANLSRAAYFTK